MWIKYPICQNDRAEAPSLNATTMIMVQTTGGNGRGLDQVAVRLSLIWQTRGGRLRRVVEPSDKHNQAKLTRQWGGGTDQIGGGAGGCDLLK